MHRSHLLISGDPISLARGAEQIKSAFRFVAGNSLKKFGNYDSHNSEVHQCP
jgi:hypothetical protein